MRLRGKHMSEAGKKKGGGLRFGAFVVVGIVVLFLIAPFGAGVRLFRQPSGSMQPTLLPGDHFVVTKWTYGYGRYSFAPFPSPFQDARFLGRAPQRGELAVFRPVPEPDRDFIKRVVGLPGERIQMVNGVLHINGEAVQRQAMGEVTFDDGSGHVISARAFRETLPGGASYVTLDRGDSETDNTPEFAVPDGAYFVMGDDRDNSADSRVRSVIGYIPIENFVGPIGYVMRAPGGDRLE